MFLKAYMQNLIQNDQAVSEKSNEKAMNRNWSNQKTNPALKTKMGNNQKHK